MTVLILSIDIETKGYTQNKMHHFILRGGMHVGLSIRILFGCGSWNAILTRESSTMVVCELPKLKTGVRFPSLAIDPFISDVLAPRHKDRAGSW